MISTMRTKRPTSPRLPLCWQAVGLDADFYHDVAVNFAGQTLTGFTLGQTVKLSVRAGNTVGNIDRLELMVTTVN